MGIFTWLGGDIGQGNNWSSGGSVGIEPGPTDDAILPNGGQVVGAANVGRAEFTGTFVFSGANLQAGGEAVSAGGSITQKNGVNAIVSSGNSLNLLGATYTLSGGALSGPQAAEFVSGAFKQFGGTNTIAEIEIEGGTYTLTTGALAVVSGGVLSGVEFVGLDASGGFIQSGGTHTVARALEIGFGGSGSYTLKGGLLTMPVSGPSPNSGYGEFIGDNDGGVGTFVQTGGTDIVADRVVVGTTQLGLSANASGTYTLGGSGVLSVNTLFVGSEDGCSGTFNFNTSTGDNAKLTISGTDTAFPGLVVGGDGVGIFVQGGGASTSQQGGGTVSAASLQVGRHFDGNGTYVLSTGVLQTSSGGYETIGGGGVGTFEQKFGSNSIGGNLFIGSGTESHGIDKFYGDGRYNLDGLGALTVAQHVVLGVVSGAVGELNIDSAGKPGAVFIVNAADSATALTVGSAGSGIFNQFAGSAILKSLNSTTPALDIGAAATGSGFVGMSGGTFAVIAGNPGGTAGAVIVGDSGSGDYEQVGGKVTFGGCLIVGNSSNGSGSFSLAGNGSTTLTVSGGVTIGALKGAVGSFSYDEQNASAKFILGSNGILTVGDAGSGTIVQGGGSVTAFGLDLGHQSSGQGAINLSGGTFSVSRGGAAIGDVGSGAFVHNGAKATANFAGGLEVGGQSGGTGLYVLSAGKLIVGSGSDGGAVIGNGEGTGAFVQAGGTGIFSGGLTVASLFARSGSFTLSGGTDTISGDAVIADAGVGAYTQSGGTATFAGKLTIANNFNASGTFALNGGSAVVKGEIDVGAGAATSGEFDFNISGGSATLGGANANAPNFKIGLGGTGILNDGGGKLKAGNVAVGTENGGSGLLNVFGAGAALSMTTLSIGSFESGSSIAGGVGALVVSNGGYVSVAKTLALNDFASADTNLNETFSGGINLSGGSLEIGGSKVGLAANTLQIDSGGVLSGHGLIQGSNDFNVTISKGGLLEAKDGLLVVNGDISGGGTVQIDNNATVDIVGAVGKNVSITFQPGGTGTLIIESPILFEGKITGLRDGDQIILARTGSSTPSPNEVVGATIASSSNSGQTLYIQEGVNILNQTRLPIGIPVSGPASDPVLTGQSTELPHYFAVTSGGIGANNYATLTLSSGSPIAQAMGLTQSAGGLGNGSLTGAGIKIGIISDSFNFDAATSKDAGAGTGAAQAGIKNGLLPSASNIIDLAAGKIISGGGHDEGRAMAEIIHAIAPGATIVFQSYRAEPEYGQGDKISAMAHAIKDLQGQHVQIIVDDIGLGAEPDRGGPANAAIDNAVMSGISYFTAAGNFRLGQPNGLPARPIFGHQANPNAVTVAAINYLASLDPPALTPAYLQTATESDSSIGAANSGKPNITAPDGGPTSFLLPPGSTLDPFFGTSAAAPAAAAVAALMMEINPQLELNPQRLATFMEITAINGGEPFSREGFGLLDGPLAIAKAAGAVTTFFDPATSAGPTLLAAAISQPFGSVSTGAVIHFQLTFNESLKVTGTPTFLLNDGGKATYDAKASQPSNAILVFDYTITSAQQTSELELTGFVTSSGKIADSASHVPVLSAMFNLPTGLSVNSPVTVTSVTSDKSGQEISAGSTAHISMTLNAPVSVTNGTSGGLTLALDNGGTAFYDSAASTATRLVFDYVVSGGEQTPDLTVFAVDLASGTSIESGGFNANISAAIGAATGVQVGAAFVTNVVPSQFGDAQPGATIKLEIDFSQPISVTTSSGSPTLTLNNGATAFYDAGATISAGSAALVFDYAVSSGQHVSNLEVSVVSSGGAVINDSHGIPVDFANALSAPFGLGIDSPLDVTSITTSQAVFADTGQSVRFVASMSEAVSLNAVDAPGGLPTLSLNDGAAATYDANASILSAGLLAFDYTVSAHDYTTNLGVTAFNQNGATIFDSAGNVLDVSTGFPFDIGIGINSFNNWKAGKIGDWSTTSNWTSGNPGPTTQATILSGGVVSSTAPDSPTVGSIATAKGATLKITAGTFTATLGTGIGVNAGAIVIGDGATLTLGGRFVNSGSVALSGTSSATRLALDGVSISGGKLQTSGASARIETVSGTNDAINGATIVSRSVVAVVSGSTLTLSGGTIGSAASVSATSGSTAIVSGFVPDAGTLALNGTTSVGASATLETLAGGTALLSGAVTNSGTLFASGAHSLVEILGGAFVTGGGIAKIGNGVVDISASGVSENVVFVAGGTGRLELADNPGDTSAFAGHVSGFGQNIHQFIELTAVAFTSAAVSASYSSSTANSGVLTVTSGGSANVVAVIDFIGHYVTSNFHITSGASGTVEIFDPPLAGTPPAGTVHSANLALFANCLAASFPAAIGHGGVLITEALEQVGLQPLLAHPRTG